MNTRGLRIAMEGQQDIMMETTGIVREYHNLATSTVDLNNRHFKCLCCEKV